MKKFKNLAIVLLITFAMVSPIALPITGNVAVVEAATIKISQSAILLEVGKTKVLKVSGTKSKVTWKTKDKAIATVASNGKVTAKDAGTTNITATVGSKKYTCEVTVTPYAAVVAQIGDIGVLLPKDWNIDVQESDDIYNAAITIDGCASNIQIAVQSTGEDALSYDDVEEHYSVMDQAYVEDLFAEVADIEISDFDTSVYESANGKVYVAQYIVTASDYSMLQTILGYSMDNNFLEITVTDAEELDLASVAKYFIDEIRVYE